VIVDNDGFGGHYYSQSLQSFAAWLF